MDWKFDSGVAMVEGSISIGWLGMHTIVEDKIFSSRVSFRFVRLWLLLFCGGMQGIDHEPFFVEDIRASIDSGADGNVCLLSIETNSNKKHHSNKDAF